MVVLILVLMEYGQDYTLHVDDKFRDFLILVLMEYGQDRTVTTRNVARPTVLILVLMEYGQDVGV